MPNENGATDRLALDEGARHFDLTATAWLVGQAVTQLNDAGERGEHHYLHAVSLLRGCDDASATLLQLLSQAPESDPMLHWCLLYVLGDVGGVEAADYLVRFAVSPLRENPRGCCEGPADTDLLLRTMAVEALGSIAERNGKAADHLLKLVKRKPARPVLIEAVKVSVALGRREQVAELLADDLRWVVDIRKADCAEIQAEPEREDGTERSFTPPLREHHAGKPSIVCSHATEV